MQVKRLMSALVGALLLFSFHASTVSGCTGIRLLTADGSTVYDHLTSAVNTMMLWTVALSGSMRQSPTT
jgi:hypothetical protein